MARRENSRHSGKIIRPDDGKPTKAYRVYVEEV